MSETRCLRRACCSNEAWTLLGAVRNPGMKIAVRGAVATVVVLSLLACQSNLRVVEQQADEIMRMDAAKELMRHAVAMDRDGTPMSPGFGRRISDEEYEEQIAALWKEILACEACKSQPAGSQPEGRKLVIFLHGAPLFGRMDTLKRLDEMQSSNLGYPIAFNWRGTFLDVYRDHLHRVRGGRYRPAWARITAPFVFAADIGRSVASLPQVAVSQALHRYDTEFLLPDSRAARRRHMQAVKANAFGNVSQEASHDPTADMATPAKLGLEAVRLGPQTLVAALVAGFGRPAWRIYRSRADATIWRSTHFRTGTIESTGPSGALGMLLQSLRRKAKDQKVPLEVSVVGHSTGAIVATNAIAEFPDIDFRNIVFLGAAATVKDFVTTVVPYLDDNPCARFYNASLDAHREAEFVKFRVMPQGSLLEMLDNLIAEPKDYLDLSMGKWKNAMLALHLIPDSVRSQIHLLQFPYQDGGYPQEHGEMDDVHDAFDPYDPSAWFDRGSAECGIGLSAQRASGRTHL